MKSPTKEWRREHCPQSITTGVNWLKQSAVLPGRRADRKAAKQSAGNDQEIKPKYAPSGRPFKRISVREFSRSMRVPEDQIRALVSYLFPGHGMQELVTPERQAIKVELQKLASAGKMLASQAKNPARCSDSRPLAG